MDNLTMIWNEVVSMMDLKLNTIQLKNWVKPLVPISMNEHTLILDCQSTFIRVMVQKKYQDLIQEYLSYICGQTMTIHLTDPSQPDYFNLVNHQEGGNSQTNQGQAGLSKQAKASYTENPNQVETSSSNDGNPSFTEGEGGQMQVETPAPSQSHTEKVAQQIEKRNQKLKKQREKNGYMTLNPKYTLENFIQGKSNDFAYAAAKAVVSNPGKTYNPLFIYGLSGLGKTHLMQGIAHAILNQSLDKKVLYITSENFMNEMIAMIENGTHKEKEKFRKKYRSIDVLLIDDIQFIAGKKATMEEVFHTFNHLKEANHQIVLSSDKPPHELKNLEERLVTRFEGGMTVDIQKPDFETRVAILNNKMKGESLTLPDYVVSFIADNITSNIRELEGVLLRVIAYFAYKKVDPQKAGKDENMALAREAMKIEEKREREISIEDIMDVVTDYYNLESNDLTGKSRQSYITLPRQIAMYLARQLTKESLVTIGRSFSRNHSTVIHALDKIEELQKKDSNINDDISILTERLKSG